MRPHGATPVVLPFPLEGKGIVISVGLVAPAPHTILLVSVPMFSIHTLATSPDFRNSRRAAPTPDGVPVRMMSPG
jgi:hypothetical protein